MWHGLLILNKERGLTSHQAVARIRRILSQSEAGHTGTLDPEATGVLVIGLGQATRFFSFLNEKLKVYRAELILGQATDTQDASGKILRESRDFSISRDRLEQAIGALTGEQEQLPPMFSAVKVKGQKLYDLARQGVEIERQPRRITVFRWEVLDSQPVYGFRDTLTCEITCSRGTYIRTLIHDLGENLGCGAHMGGLIRLSSGDFNLETAVTLAQVEEYLKQGRLNELLVSLNTALSHIPSIQVEPVDVPKVMNGGKLSAAKYGIADGGGSIPGTLVRVLSPPSSEKEASLVLAVAELKSVESHLYWQPVKVCAHACANHS